jgi:hypothetical protein
MRNALFVLAALVLTAAPATPTPIGALDEADRAVIETLAVYDEATARYALEAATEADVLSDVAARQEYSRERFQQLLSPYPREVQEQLFEITRYPDLIARIVEGGPKDAAELEAIAALYPEEVRGAALAAGSNNWKVVARIDALLRDEAVWLETRLADLSEVKREAFRALVATPELLALLAENATLAVLLGDAYEREPEAVVAWLADVRDQVETQSAEEARDFARNVETDPELAGEIAAATTTYELETGYSAYQPTVVHQTYVHVRPYSYWVGYPWWYDVSYVHYAPWYYWYPRTHWAFGGFYFGPRLVLSFGLPHGGFWGWYFHRPIHHRYYPRVTHHVVRHYDRHHARHHRHYRHRPYHPYRVHRHRAAAHAVHRFRRDAERSMPRAFLRDDRNRVDRFREYGRLRSDWERDHRRERDGAGEVRRRTEMLQRVKVDGRRYPRLQQAARRPVERSQREEGERRARELRERKARGSGFARRTPPHREARAEPGRDRRHPTRREARVEPGRDRQPPPQREAKEEPRRDRPTPRRAEERQSHDRERAMRVARAEPAARSGSSKPRAEAKRRPARQPSGEVTRRFAPQPRAEERRPQRSRQQARPAPRAPEPRRVQPQRPRREVRSIARAPEPRRVQPERPRREVRSIARAPEPRHTQPRSPRQGREARAQPRTHQANGQQRTVPGRAHSRAGGWRRTAR